MLIRYSRTVLSYWLDSNFQCPTSNVYWSTQQQTQLTRRQEHTVHQLSTRLCKTKSRKRPLEGSQREEEGEPKRQGPTSVTKATGSNGHDQRQPSDDNFLTEDFQRTAFPGTKFSEASSPQTASQPESLNSPLSDAQSDESPAVGATPPSPQTLFLTTPPTDDHNPPVEATTPSLQDPSTKPILTLLSTPITEQIASQPESVILLLAGSLNPTSANAQHSGHPIPPTDLPLVQQESPRKTLKRVRLSACKPLKVSKLESDSHTETLGRVASSPSQSSASKRSFPFGPSMPAKRKAVANPLVELSQSLLSPHIPSTEGIHTNNKTTNKSNNRASIHIRANKNRTTTASIINTPCNATIAIHTKVNNTHTTGIRAW